MPRPTPEAWATLMRRAGIQSIRQLCEAADLGYPTVDRIVHGTGKQPRDVSVLKIAHALKVPPEEIWNMIGQNITEPVTPWQPPEESARLTQAERDALGALIKAIVNRRAEGPEPASAPSREHLDLAAWRRKPGDAPSYSQYLEGLGEEPQA